MEGEQSRRGWEAKEATTGECRVQAIPHLAPSLSAFNTFVNKIPRGISFLEIIQGTASSVSDDPVIHFVIFVPSAVRRPLRILDGEGMTQVLLSWRKILIPPSCALYQVAYHLPVLSSFLNGGASSSSTHPLTTRSHFSLHGTSNQPSPSSGPSCWSY